MSSDLHRFLCRWAEISILCLCVYLFLALGGGDPSEQTRDVHVNPDMIEQVYTANEFSRGHFVPVIPVGHEIRPIAYSPVHPAVLAIWIRLHGGNWTAVLTWPLVATLLGLLLLYGSLIVAGMPAFLRLVSFALCITSITTIDISRNCLQEPTMILFFGLGLLTWQIAMIGRTSGFEPPKRGHILHFGVLGVSGMSVAALICMRGTFAVLGLTMLIQALYVYRHQWAAIRFLWPWLVGGIAVVVPTVLVVHSATGLYALDGYGYHYYVVGRLFSWHNIFRYPFPLEQVPCLEMPHWQRFFAGFLGYRITDQVAWGSGLQVILCIGSILAVGRLRRPEDTRQIMPWLGLYALLQLPIFLPYKHYMPRCYFSALYAVIVSGTWFWGKQVAAWRERSSPAGFWARLVLLGIAVFALVAGTPQRRLEMSRVYGERQKPDWTWRASIDNDLASHVLDGAVIRELDGPILIDRLSVANARLYWKMQDATTRPIYQITCSATMDPYCEAHLATYKYGFKTQPSMYLPGIDPRWAENTSSDHIWLMSSDGTYVRRNVSKMLVARFGSFTLYYPSNRELFMTPLVALLYDQYQVCDESQPASDWRILYILPRSTMP